MNRAPCLGVKFTRCPHEGLPPLASWEVWYYRIDDITRTPGMEWSRWTEGNREQCLTSLRAAKRHKRPLVMIDPSGIVQERYVPRGWA